ncbi:MAG: hypothetical protein KGQ89_06595, partial [Verrucomicrobia bacterium]|nr:hypothetical protein [Verrucomicrobiota bacterium]
RILIGKPSMNFRPHPQLDPKSPMRNKYFCHKQSISNFSFCNKENYTKKSCLRDLPGAGPMPQF